MKNHNITALVTGSAGFIGRHLCEALRVHPDVKNVIEYDQKNHILQNINNRTQIEDLFKNNTIDIIFHLASTVTVPYNKEDVYEHVHTNIRGTQVLLENAPRRCRFIFTSSVAVYGDTSPYPSTETMGENPLSIYAATKIGAEHLINAYTNMGMIDGLSLRLTSVVGKNMTHGCLKDFLTRIKSPNANLQVWGEPPGVSRPFIHVSDVVRALIYFGIDSDRTPSVLNISTEEPLTIEDVANAALYIMNPTKEIEWNQNYNGLGDIQKIRIDTEEAKSLGFMPFMNSYNAIIKAVEENMIYVL